MPVETLATESMIILVRELGFPIAASFISKYNKLITLSINTTPIYSQGQIIGTLSSGRDITDTVKHAEELNILNHEEW